MHIKERIFIVVSGVLLILMSASLGRSGSLSGRDHVGNGTTTCQPAPASSSNGVDTRDLSGSSPRLTGCDVFPTDNVWNAAVDKLPVAEQSAAYVASIGISAHLHADFGSGDWPSGSGSPIGIPYATVPGNQPRVAVTFDYDDESDPGPYPVPPDAPIEGGLESDGDRHVLIVDRDRCLLYELFYAFPQPDGSWQAGSGAVFDLKSNALRQAGWTSADAAGLSILPGLVRYEEVAAGEIKHALRFTAPKTRRAYVWPARHYASSLTGEQYPPMGQRFRLRADYDVSSFSPEVRVILRALKKYGMMLADNGSAWFISGVPDERWDNEVLHELHEVPGSAFEAVDASQLMVNANSGQTVALAPIIIDHTCTDLSKVPVFWINRAKQDFKLSYGHTSHGSQIVTGMDSVRELLGYLFDYDHDGADGALSFHDYEPEGDLGDPSWASRTRDLLDAPGCDRNLILWAWCGQVSDASAQDIETYLSIMNQLEANYPQIKFVYMTGHLDGSGESGNLHLRNNQIRQYCQTHNKVLFDFANIESYDPDGNAYLSQGADDGCNYDGGNWAQQWCASHSASDLCVSCGDEDCCAHSQPLNCNLKGRAFWWMMARLAGWDGLSGSGLLKSGDLNGDGTDDLIGVNFSNSIYYTVDLSTWHNISGALTNLLTADLNGDGTDEIVGINSSGKLWHTADLATWSAIPGRLVELTTGHFNQHAMDDLAGVNAAGEIYYTTNLTSWVRIPGKLRSIISADFNNDGLDDLAGVNQSGKIYYSLNLSSWISVPGDLQVIVSGDLNNDGRDDLAGINKQGKIYYTTNLQTWTNIPGALTDLVVGDFNHDGCQDLAGVNVWGNIYYTIDLNKWQRINGVLSRLHSADLNGDQRDDLVGVNPCGSIYYTVDLKTWKKIPGAL